MLSDNAFGVIRSVPLANVRARPEHRHAIWENAPMHHSVSLPSPRSWSRSQRVLLWGGVGIAGTLLGFALLIFQAIEQERNAFETGARIAHRLLSQRAVQHEAVLATLSLMQPAPNARLPAVYPEFLHVWRRTAGQQWPAVPELRAALNAAEQRTARMSLAVAQLKEGRFWIVAPAPDRGAASGAAYALEVSLPLMVPWSEWPFGSDPDAMRARGTDAWLERGADRWSLHGAPAAHAAEPALRRFIFRKQLAAQSQPFDLVVERSVRMRDLPWTALVAWLVTWTALLAGVAQVLRQRRARQRAEELLRLGQVARLNALGELAAGLAHELNQPLTAVLAGTQAATRMLADEPPELDAARDAMAHTVQQARRAADVVARLRRAIERPNAGLRTAVDLGAAARSVLHLLEPECRKRGVTVRLAAEQAVVAHADPVAIEQILHNLIGNALSALEGTAQPVLAVAVAHDPQAGMATLSVRDNGPGVAPELAGKLFEPFISGRPGGLGLGLSLCDTLAQEMGGRLHYRPAAPGAEFILELPHSAATERRTS